MKRQKVIFLIAQQGFFGEAEIGDEKSLKQDDAENLKKSGVVKFKTEKNKGVKDGS